MSLAFIPAENPAEAGVLSPTLTVGWSLNFEIMFYLIFFISLFFNRKIIPLLLGALIIGLYFLSNRYDGLKFYHQTRLFEFLYGVAIAVIYLKTTIIQRIGNEICVLGIILSLYVIISFKGDPGLIWGIPSAFLVLFFISLEKKLHLNNFLYSIGNCSYSLYLCHRPIIALFVVIANKYQITNISLAIPAAIISIIISFYSYRYIEKGSMLALKELIFKMKLLR